MPSHRDLELLFDYHYWARDRLLDAVEALSAEQFTRDLGRASGRCAIRWRTSTQPSGRAFALDGHSPTALLPAECFQTWPAFDARWVEHEGEMRAYLPASTRWR